MVAYTLPISIIVTKGWGTVKEFNDLTSTKEGFVMKNFETGITITSTEKFVEAWKKRGFTIISKGKITLLGGSKSNGEEG